MYLAVALIIIIASLVRLQVSQNLINKKECLFYFFPHLFQSVLVCPQNKPTCHMSYFIYYCFGNSRQLFCYNAKFAWPKSPATFTAFLFFSFSIFSDVVSYMWCLSIYNVTNFNIVIYFCLCVVCLSFCVFNNVLNAEITLDVIKLYRLDATGSERARRYNDFSMHFPSEFLCINIFIPCLLSQTP